MKIMIEKSERERRVKIMMKMKIEAMIFEDKMMIRGRERVREREDW